MHSRLLMMCTIFCAVLFFPAGPLIFNFQQITKHQQLPAVDLLAQALRKGAAKCDKHCDVRDPVNHQTPER